MSIEKREINKVKMQKYRSSLTEEQRKTIREKDRIYRQKKRIGLSSKAKEQETKKNTRRRRLARKKLKKEAQKLIINNETENNSTNKN